MTTYFLFLFICMILNKKILISEVNFQCGSKNRETLPFKETNVLATVLFTFRVRTAEEVIL